MRFAGVLLFSLFITCRVSGQVSFESSNLPIVIIDTHGATIPDEPKITADMGIIDNGPGNRNHVTDPYNDYDGKIGIELRGSSSQMFPKKNYGIETRDPLGNDSAVSILGMPKESDWVLHGPYSDKSLIRNFLTFKLARELGWYASRTRLCEVIINGDYKGLYVFMEKIKRDKNRVDISKLKSDEISGDDLTGGYIVKIDKFDGGNSGAGWESPYPPPGRTDPNQVIFFQFDYPKADKIVQQQKQYIEDFVTDFEEALRDPDFRDPHTGYRAFINDDSFVDYAIISELTRNIDAYRLSTFLYKDKDSKDGKMYIGPIWDYNLAFGNADYCSGSDTGGWAWDFNNVCPKDFWLIPFWWNRFLQDRQFVEKLKSRWAELRQGPYSNSNIMHYVDSVVLVLDEARQRNFQRWDVLGKYVWPNNFVGNTYEEEIAYFKGWIADRLNWLDINITKLNVITALKELPDELNAYPNPFHGYIRFEVPSGTGDAVRVSVTDPLGREMAVLRAPSDKSGKTLMQWDGKNKNGKSLAGGIYLVQIYVDEKLVATEKIIKQ